MLTTLLRGTLCAVALMFATTGSVLAETAKEVFERVHAKSKEQKTIQYKMRNEMEMQGGAMSMTATGTSVTMRDGEKMMIRVEMDSTTKMGDMEMKGKTLMVSDGTNMWMEQDQMGQKMVMKMAAPTSAMEEESIREALEQGESKVLPDEKVEGYQCDVIEVTSPSPMGDGSSATSTFYFTKDHGVMVKMVMKSSQLNNTMTVTDLKVNGDVDKGQFSYTPPEGVTVQEM